MQPKSPTSDAYKDPVLIQNITIININKHEKNKIKVKNLERSNSTAVVDKTLFTQNKEMSGMSSHQKSAILDIVQNNEGSPVRKIRLGSGRRISIRKNNTNTENVYGDDEVIKFRGRQARSISMTENAPEVTQDLFYP